jgi:hypothetical protein
MLISISVVILMMTAGTVFSVYELSDPDRWYL